VSRALVVGPALALIVTAGALAAQQRPARPASPRDTAAADSTQPVTYRREVYSYQGGPRDPFLPLIRTGDVGPEIGDLRLVGITYDARGGRSVAVVRARDNPRAIRLRRGDQIGRLRVLQIRQYEVVFQVEEFGFERQETLTLQRPEAIQ
jgi:hypothetical protein